jgi:hypothetical protein
MASKANSTASCTCSDIANHGWAWIGNHNATTKEVMHVARDMSCSWSYENQRPIHVKARRSLSNSVRLAASAVGHVTNVPFQPPANRVKMQASFALTLTGATVVKAGM